jgi:hypothetical protein
MRTIIAITCAALALCTVFVSNAKAGGTAGPIVTRDASRPGQLPIMHMPASRGHGLIPRAGNDAGLTQIANTLTQYKTSPYWGWEGYAVCGPTAGCASDTEQWWATPFTPSTNHVATKVELAGLHDTGGNTFFASIYSDSSGLPGKALETFQLKDLPQVICCEVASATNKTGVQLQGGTQYWLVLGTNANDTSALAVWTFSELANVQKNGSNLAVYCSGDGCGQIGLQNNAWNPQNNMLFGFAYDVLGK